MSYADPRWHTMRLVDGGMKSRLGLFDRAVKSNRQAWVHCASSGCVSRDWLDERRRLYPQRVCQPYDVHQADVSFASLDSTDVVSVQVRQLSQALLREAALGPQFADAFAKQYARI